MSRRPLALVRRRLAALADRGPERRWAAVLVSVAHDPLDAAIRPLDAARLLLRHAGKLLPHEDVDPSAARRWLLDSVERRARRLHPTAAAA